MEREIVLFVAGRFNFSLFYYSHTHDRVYIFHIRFWQLLYNLSDINKEFKCPPYLFDKLNCMKQSSR